MMKDDFFVRAQPRIQLLEKEQKEEIHRSSLRLLQRNGAIVHEEQALGLLREAGCTVDGNHRVLIPEQVVSRALQSVPEKIEIYDRSGAPAMSLEERKAHFGTGSDTPNVIDFHSGKRRPAVLDDVKRAARLADGLDKVDFIMSLGLASDTPVERSDRYHFAAMMENSSKPIMFTAWSLEGLQDIHRMAVIAAGDADQLQRQPFLIHYAMAIAPFIHPKDSIQKVLFCAEKGIPVEYHSVDIGGSTAPATLAGSFVQGNARMLSGLVIHQLKSPGAPLIVDTSVVFLDMQTMASPYMTPEVLLASIMNKEMALYYGIPTFAKAGAGDAKVLDQQAGVEIGITIFNEYLIGNNLIHDMGYLEMGMTGSLESLVICDEVVSFVKRFGRGVDISPEHLALEVIEEVGPAGNYLTHDHTLKYFREEFWFPNLMDHNNHDSWVKQGSRSLFDRAHQKAARILEEHRPRPLEQKVVEEIHRIAAGGA
ncbi:MAG: trimethylamine methyltransferase family protein [Spirochaetaceae bacterium]|nr:MAG: trimethylamine methyltransferase family protein [Spirochaetaceae bacterium]